MSLLMKTTSLIPKKILIFQVNAFWLMDDNSI